MHPIETYGLAHTKVSRRSMGKFVQLDLKSSHSNVNLSKEPRWSNLVPLQLCATLAIRSAQSRTKTLDVTTC